MIEDYYEGLKDSFMLRFMAQSAVLMSSLLPNTEPVIEELPLAFLHPLTLDYVNYNPVLSGNPTYLVEAVHETVSAGLVRAEDAITILKALRHDLSNDDQAYFSELSILVSALPDTESANLLQHLLSGTIVGDELHLGTGQDNNLEGSSENDDFVFRGGEGNDTISTSTAFSGEVDQLIFADHINQSDLFSFRSDVDGNGIDDLVLGLNGSAGSITLLDAFKSTNEERYRLDEYVYVDGTIQDFDGFLTATLDQDRSNDFFI